MGLILWISRQFELDRYYRPYFNFSRYSKRKSISPLSVRDKLTQTQSFSLFCKHNLPKLGYLCQNHRAIVLDKENSSPLPSKHSEKRFSSHLRCGCTVFLFYLSFVVCEGDRKRRKKWIYVSFFIVLSLNGAEKIIILSSESRLRMHWGRDLSLMETAIRYHFIRVMQTQMKFLALPIANIRGDCNIWITDEEHQSRFKGDFLRHIWNNFSDHLEKHQPREVLNAEIEYQMNLKK